MSCIAPLQARGIVLLRPPTRWQLLVGTTDQVRRLDARQLAHMAVDRIRQSRGATPSLPWHHHRRPGELPDPRTLVQRLKLLFEGSGHRGCARQSSDTEEQVNHLLQQKIRVAGQWLPLSAMRAPADLDLEARHSLQRFYFLSRLRFACDSPARVGAVADVLEYWHRSAPDPVAWSSFSVTERLMQWSVLLAQLGPSLPPETLHNCCASMWLQANWLLRHLEWRAANNHLLFNARTLLLAAWIFRDVPGAEKMERRAQDLLDRELPRQFGPDGANRESSAGYQLWTTQCLVECERLCMHLGADQRLQNTLAAYRSLAASALSVLTMPDGTVAPFGDSKDVDLDVQPADLGVLCSPIGRRGWRDSWGQCSPEVEPPDFGLATTTGVVSGRWPEPQGTSCIVMKAGPLSALPRNPGHGHADVLSFQMFWRGVSLLTDTGSGTYEDGPIRSYQRSALAHNTVYWGAGDQALLWRSFRIAHLPVVHRHLASMTRATLSIDASCRISAPGRLCGAIHRRHLVCIEAALLVIVDRLTAPDACEPTLSLIFSSDVELSTQGDQFGLATPAGPARLATFESGPNMSPVVWRQETSAVSPQFGQYEDTAALRLRRRMTGDRPLSLITVVRLGDAAPLELAQTGAGLRVQVGGQQWDVDSVMRVLD